jgi:hypothetical protein
MQQQQQAAAAAAASSSKQQQQAAPQLFVVNTENKKITKILFSLGHFGTAFGL